MSDRPRIGKLSSGRKSSPRYDKVAHAEPMSEWTQADRIAWIEREYALGHLKRFEPKLPQRFWPIFTGAPHWNPFGRRLRSVRCPLHMNGSRWLGVRERVLHKRWNQMKGRQPKRRGMPGCSFIPWGSYHWPLPSKHLHDDMLRRLPAMIDAALAPDPTASAEP